jgi:hypothetical protein
MSHFFSSPMTLADVLTLGMHRIGAWWGAAVTDRQRLNG